MGQDTKSMSRYTLPTGTTTETIIFSNPSIDKDRNVLSCEMSFASDRGGFILIMQAFPAEAPSFDGGLRLERQDESLGPLSLQLQSNSAWSGYTVTAKCGDIKKDLDEVPFSIAVSPEELMHISITFQKGTQSWDPKIKVIPPH